MNSKAIESDFTACLLLQLRRGFYIIYGVKNGQNEELLYAPSLEIGKERANAFCIEHGLASYDYQKIAPWTVENILTIEIKVIKEKKG
jgi:hypothetical protein